MNSTPDYFSSESLRHDLKGKTVRGGLWTAIAQASSILIQIATVPIMARLLDQNDYGLFAMATFFTGFAIMFVDAGLAMATIQSSKLTSQQATNLFWLCAASGTAMAGIIIAISPLIARFYDEPSLVAITCALAPSFIFSGLSIQAVALLRRAMEYKRLAIVGISSALLGQMIAIPWAYYSRNYEALVAMQLAQTLGMCVVAWWMCGWYPGLPRRGAGVRHMVHFGVNLTGFNFVNYFSRNSDNMLIGWWWGKGPTGGYERAYKLFMFPLIKLSGPLTSVAVPVLSRLAGEPEKYRQVYLKMLGAALMFVTPLAAFLMVNAENVVQVALGTKWLDITPILAVLSLCGLTQMAYSSLGWLYISQGKSKELLRWGSLNSCIIVSSFLIGLPWGPLGVAVSYTAIYYAVVLPLAFYTAGYFNLIATRDLWKSLVRPVLLGGTVATSSFLVSLVLAEGTTPIKQLGINATVASLVLAVGLLSVKSEIASLRDSLITSPRPRSRSANPPIYD